MKKFKTIFKYTYLWNIKSVGFIVTTIIGIILIALSMNFNVIRDKIRDDSASKIAFCDYDNNFSFTETFLNDLGFNDCEFVIAENAEIEDIKQDIEKGKGDIDYIITVYSKNKESIEVYSKSSSKSEIIKNITNYLKTIYISNRAENLNLDSEVVNRLMADVQVDLIDTDEAKEGNIILVYFLILILFIMITFYGINVLNSVVEEKNNRIMETLITMSKPIELFCGKVLGVCATAFTQVLIFIVAGSIAIKFNESVNSFV